MRKIVVDLYIAAYKRTVVPEEQLSICRGIVKFLEACCANEIEQVDNYLDDIFNLLFPNICVLTEQSLNFSEDCPAVTTTTASVAAATQPNDILLKLRNETFNCFRVASGRSADKEVRFF